MTRGQVGKILKVSAASVVKLERSGYLHPYQDPTTRIRYFQIPDVMACKERLERDAKVITGGGNAESESNRELAEGMRRSEERHEFAELEFRARPTVDIGKLIHDNQIASPPVTVDRENQSGPRPQSIMEMIGDAVRLAVESVDVDKVVMLGAIALATNPKAEQYFDRLVDVVTAMIKPAVENIHSQTAEAKKEGDE